jgi:S-adenosylmethionine:tRNA ribosyltransferase-isomerase
VKSETIEDHGMHTEQVDVSVAAIENILTHIDKVIAVGTTSMRTIETLYWMGVKLAVGNKQWATNKEQVTRNKEQGTSDTYSTFLSLKQWECYELESTLSAAEALQVLLSWMKENKTERLLAKTQILIAPGYQFNIVKGLITNFHQPQSTLLLLIAAFIGKDWKKLYEYGLQNNFRFLSYGDGCLLWSNQ